LRKHEYAHQIPGTAEVAFRQFIHFSDLLFVSVFAGAGAMRFPQRNTAAVKFAEWTGRHQR
jgi:hypothetical protein